MIARIRGELMVRELERVEVMTPGGVAYEAFIPHSVFERLPRLGEEVTLRTFQVVREDAVTLYGFLEDVERVVFQRLLAANGVGPRLALAMVGALGAQSVVRAVREKNAAVFLPTAGVGARAPGMEEAMRALGALGVTQPDADRALRAVVQEHGSLPAPELIRHALARLK